MAGFAVYADRSRQTYQALVDRAPFGILRIDQGGHVRMSNPHARVLLRIPPEMRHAGPIGRYLLVDDPAAPVPWARPVAGEALRLQTRAAPVCRLLASCVRLDDDDCQLVLRDETSRLALEEELRQAQRLEAVGRFTASVAHDFNNLLSAILLSNELTLDALAHESPVHALAHETRRAAERAVILTRRLLTFGRGGNGEPRVLDIGTVVHELAPMLHRVIRRSAHLALDVPAGLPTIRADRGHIEQILLNLVIDASDAMPAGGSILLAAAHVAAAEGIEAGNDQAGTSPGMVRLSVADTGIGMDAETQRRIFEPFFTTKADGRGTGLGLATVASLVERAHGRIGVTSAARQGTTFTVAFPALDVPAEASNATASLGAPRGDAHIMVVDDDEDVRRLAARTLRALGYSVTEARRARDVLEYLDASRVAPALLVVDVTMPGMDGPALVRTSRARGHVMPVLFMSGTIPAAHDAREHPAGDVPVWLPKPFTTLELAIAVRECLDDAWRLTRGAP